MFALLFLYLIALGRMRCSLPTSVRGNVEGATLVFITVYLCVPSERVGRLSGPTFKAEGRKTNKNVDDAVAKKAITKFSLREALSFF